MRARLNGCCVNKQKETFVSRFLQIVWNEINVIYAQIVILFLCFIAHRRGRRARSVIKRKQSVSSNFWPHFAERAGRNVFARDQWTNDNGSIIMHQRIRPITVRLLWAEEGGRWISRQSKEWLLGETACEVFWRVELSCLFRAAHM